MSQLTRLGIRRGSDLGAQAQWLSLGTHRGRRLKDRERTLLLVIRVNITLPTFQGKPIRMAPLGTETTTLRHCLQECLLDLYPILLDPLRVIMDIPLA